MNLVAANHSCGLNDNDGRAGHGADLLLDTTLYDFRFGGRCCLLRNLIGRSGGPIFLHLGLIRHDD